MDWDYLYVAVSAIPATFWGVLAGSGFTLLGVWATNRDNTQRLERQLNHDAAQRRIDREQALRKEIYFAAAEAISAGLLTVARFADLEIADGEITAPFVARAPAIAKVHVIATVRTAAAVERLAREMGAVYMRLLIKRLPVRSIKNHLAGIDSSIATFD
jgi:hypothetical protein